MKTLSFVCLLAVVPGSVFAQQDRAHQLASQAAQQKAATCPKPNNLTLQQCHDQFPDGCSTSAHPTYDAYLNFLKDQDPAVDLAPTGVLAGADFAKLESQLSQLSHVARRARKGGRGGGGGRSGGGLTSTNHAAFANQLAGKGEGNVCTVIAYLYFAEDTGASNPPNSETCNCRLLTPNTFDFHIGLGFDKALADKIRQTKPQPVLHQPTTMEKTSVVAEMTPYSRTTRHPNWGFDKVKALQGQQVKVVGQLMADNDHFNAQDDCGFHGAGAGCWRSTVWEIHPILKFYVCNVNTGCDGSSPDSAWTDLDNP